jgi:hypothetical protein
MKKNNKTRKIILLCVGDLVSKFTFYDRKNDEELSGEQLDKAIENGIVTIDEIVEKFREELKKVYK